MKVKDNPEQEEARAVQEDKVGHIEPVVVEPVADGHHDSHRTDVEAAIGHNQREVEHHVSQQEKLLLYIVLQFSFPSCIS